MLFTPRPTWTARSSKHWLNKKSSVWSRRSRWSSSLRRTKQVWRNEDGRRRRNVHSQEPNASNWQRTYDYFQVTTTSTWSCLEIRTTRGKDETEKLHTNVSQRRANHPHCGNLRNGPAGTGVAHGSDRAASPHARSTSGHPPHHG